MSDDSSSKPPAPIRARRWSGSTSAQPPPRPYRLAIRLVGIPAAAIAGVVVSAAGMGVAAWALLFLIRTYRETRRTALATLKAARAAVMSATTAVGVEIPRLILFHLDLANTDVANWTAALQNPPVDVSVKNYGRTPAFVISRSVEIFSPK